jgi:tetratricopeptide (TPR) repeat protein
MIPAPMPTEKRPSTFGSAVIGFLLLFAISFILYSPSLAGAPLWDDTYLVGWNPLFRSPLFSFEVFKHYLFVNSASLYYRPVQNLSYILDYCVWGDNAFGFHFGNVLYHALAGCLIWRLLRVLLAELDVERNEMISCSVALLWTIHPIHSAAVAYISGRADSLATVFGAFAWMLATRAERVGASARGALLASAAGLSLLMGLCAKEIAVVWLVLFVAYQYTLRKRSFRTRLMITAAAGLLMTCYVGLRSLPGPRSVVEIMEQTSSSTRFVLLLRALGDYFGLVAFPSRLLMERFVYVPSAYDSARHWTEEVRLEYLSLVAVAGIIGLFVLAVHQPRMRRVFAFGLGWFLIGFLPISNIVPLNAQVAEHWIYVPSIGLLLFAIASLFAFTPTPRTWIAVVVLVLAATALGTRTWIRSADWTSERRFYESTLAQGGNRPRIVLNLANVYLSEGKHEEAEKILRQAVTDYPGYVNAEIALGRALVRLGRTEEGERFLKTSAEPGAPPTQQFTYSFGALSQAELKYNSNEPEAAIDILERAIASDPEVFLLHEFRARILWKTRGAVAALPGVQRFVQDHWWHYGARVVLGRLQIDSGEIDQGIETLRRAAMLDIHSSEPYSQIAQAELDRGNLEGAYQAQLRAVRRNGELPLQQLLLADILRRMGRPEEAQEAMLRADELRKAWGAKG